MNIALINPRYETERFKVIKQNEPVSIQYLKSYLNQNGYECDCIDFFLYEDYKSLLLYIAENYGVVGISVFYPFNPVPLAKELKKLNQNVIILIGGPGATLNFETFLAYDSPIEYALFNEGEYNLKVLIDYLHEKVSVDSLLNLAYKKQQEIIIKKEIKFLDINTINYPLRAKSEISNYIPSIVSSRGCNGKCIFCSNRYMGRWRGRNYNNVVDEIEYISKKLEQRYFQFIEPNFLGDIERGYQIANEIIRRNLDVSFDFSCRVDSLINGKYAIEQLKKAGASRLLLGVENFYNDTLEAWNKEIKYENIGEALNFLNETNLPCTISLILFHKEVSKKELEFNIDAIENIDSIRKIDNLFNKMIFYPGTRLNCTKEIIEWEFDQDEIKFAYEKCINYRKKQEKLRSKLTIYNNSLSTYDKVNNYIMKNLYYFMDTKEKEFSILKYVINYKFIEKDKSLLTYHDFSLDKLVKFKQNPSIIINEYSEGVYIFTDTFTGISYNIDTISYLIYILLLTEEFSKIPVKLRTYIDFQNPEEYFHLIIIVFQFIYLNILDIESILYCEHRTNYNEEP